MQFKKLRLHGFKSFVDQTEVLIEEGLTGVVGPNGCGKSNVIESLRWVMGETSAKRMRGKEMDDVIFGGSSKRPPRNIAEVTLTLDNKDRLAPAAFNEDDELEITRRIERGKGSGYRINGRDVRARDVQLLFADLASGANSTAIVSQGRIGALIGAKPAERRTLLEEAAGIRGLHSRRHEAELRLKAAETNLERLEDVIATLDLQNEGLQKQARQANRYRRLSEQVRRFEAMLLHIKWLAAVEQLTEANAALKAVQEVVSERTELAASGTTLQLHSAEKLPALRLKEASASAELQKYQLTERELAHEESRIQQARHDLDTRLQQLAMDASREQSLESDAKEAVSRLSTEKTTLDDAGEDQLMLVEELREALEITRDDVEEKEATLNQQTEYVAGLEAQKNAYTQQGEQSAYRVEKLRERAQELAQEKENLSQDMELVEELEISEETVFEAETALESMRETLEATEDSQQNASRHERDIRDTLQSLDVEARNLVDAIEARNREKLEALEVEGRDLLNKAESTLQNLKAESAGLTKVLASSLTTIAEPLSEHIDVTTGFEAALGAALGDDLEASIQLGQPIHWHEVELISKDDFSLPDGMKPLLDYVKAPAALARRLAQVAVAPSVETASALQSSLKQGQRIVTKEGGLWRWDGYSVALDVPSSAAQKMEQKKRLQALENLIEEARIVAEETVEELYIKKAALQSETESKREEIQQQNEERLEATQTAYADAVEAAAIADDTTRKARENQQSGYTHLNQTRQTHSQMASRAAAAQSRLANVEDNARRVAEELSDSLILMAEAQEKLKGLEAPAPAWDRVNKLRVDLAELRRIASQKQSSYDNLHRESEAKQNRLRAIESEEHSWQERLNGTSERMEELQMRAEQAGEEKLLLETRPEEIAEQRMSLLDKISTAEHLRKELSDQLSEAERMQFDADRALKEAEQALAEAREMRVRLHANVDQAQQASDNVAERIMETLECYPKDVLKAGGIAEDEDIPPRAEVESKFERFSKERENMGAVNLRAEQEALELQTRITNMEKEHADLIEAIGKLRQGISALNKEGRERLLKAFDEVNGHFKELFVKLFGGGEAELKLTEADDPLQAGLEIMASPPGKRMQIMSLLSGGEQALTALALLFAVFLTNPAPICVLDEVDAPLDDANVDRFCKMLEEMSLAGSTRFLVVTHHRMTMARVDRLFGVTMAERGVSQLVSVDLRRAAQIRETD